MNKQQLESIAKTTLGKVVPLNQVLTGFRYVKQAFDHRKSSRLMSAAGEIFISIDGRSFCGRPKHLALVAMPVDQNGACTAFGMGIADARASTAYRIIAWSENVSLVMVNDPHQVADQWLCFVPTDEVDKAIKTAEAAAKYPG